MVPDGKTLTLTGTLTNDGTLNVSGIVEVAGYADTGTLNLLSGSKSKGLVAAPTDAATGWVWTFGDQNWSDQIAVTSCNATPSISPSPICGNRELDGVRYYYYNWHYVNQNSATMCPDGWRLPVHGDWSTLNGSTTAQNLWSVWGKAGYYEYWSDSAGGWAGDGTLQLWTSTVGESTNTMYIVFVGNWGIEYGQRNEKSGIQVRCVK